MARRIAWSPEAIEDLESIATYIQRDSPWYAQVVTTKIFAMAESLSEDPERGRMVPEVQDVQVLERFVYSYRVIYRVEAERVLIAAVIHGRRLLEPFVSRISPSDT
jgi:plasmid stabilization system protein ParE